MPICRRRGAISPSAVRNALNVRQLDDLCVEADIERRYGMCERPDLEQFRLRWTCSAERIWSEIKWTVAVPSGATDKTGRAEIGQIRSALSSCRCFEHEHRMGLQTAAARETPMGIEAFARSASYGLHTSPAGSPPVEKQNCLHLCLNCSKGPMLGLEGVYRSSQCCALVESAAGSRDFGKEFA